MEILLVEDKIGSSMSKILEKWGYRVHLAEEGETAWKILLEEKIEFFLIDWMLPQMSGLELIKKIRTLAQYRSTPVIMISGRTGKEDIASAVQAGIDSYMAKPFTVKQLRKRIEEVLERRRKQAEAAPRVQRILRGHRAFDARGEDPLLLLGFGANDEERLALAGDQIVDCLWKLAQGIASFNAENEGMKLGYLLLESTGEVAQRLKTWSIRQRTRMVVLSTRCKGNSLLLVRLLRTQKMERLPLVIVVEADDDVPAELQMAGDEGELILAERGRLEEEVWKELLYEHAREPWEE